MAKGANEVTFICIPPNSLIYSHPLGITYAYLIQKLDINSRETFIISPSWIRGRLKEASDSGGEQLIDCDLRCSDREEDNRGSKVPFTTTTTMAVAAPPPHRKFVLAALVLQLQCECCMRD